MAEQRTLEAELLTAADAVVERWHSRDWKAPHTAEYIARLSAAVGAVKHRAPPALGEDGLPELEQSADTPEFFQMVCDWANKVPDGPLWSDIVRHIHDYAGQAQRDAVADRPTWTDVQVREKDIRALQSEVIELRAQFARQSAAEGAPVCVACNGAGEYEHKGQDTRCRVCGGTGSTAGAVLAGWKLVPVEPTPEMIAAMHFKGDVAIAIGHAQFYEDAVKDYAAMLAAAPSNQSPAEEA